jgi:hypothetical protein
LLNGFNVKLNKPEAVSRNSPANPLPAAFYGAKFRCRQARSNRGQATDARYIFDVQSVLFEARILFFPAVREDAMA